MNQETILWIVIAIAGYQLFVTGRVLLGNQYTATQRILQTALIWLVPLVGAILCHLFIDSDSRASKPRDTSFTRDSGDSPPGIGSDGHHG